MFKTATHEDTFVSQQQSVRIMFEIATHEHAAADIFVSQQHSIRITVFEIATHAHAAADTFVSQQRSVRIVFKSTTY